MAGLNREITIPGITGKKKGGRPTELPQKNSINLAQGVSGTQNRTMTLIAFGAAVIVIVILCKLRVIDVLAGAMASNGPVSRMESQVQELVALLEQELPLPLLPVSSLLGSQPQDEFLAACAAAVGATLKAE